MGDEPRGGKNDMAGGREGNAQTQKTTGSALVVGGSGALGCEMCRL